MSSERTGRFGSSQKSCVGSAVLQTYIHYTAAGKPQPPWCSLNCLFLRPPKPPGSLSRTGGRRLAAPRPPGSAGRRAAPSRGVRAALPRPALGEEGFGQGAAVTRRRPEWARARPTQVGTGVQSLISSAVSPYPVSNHAAG